MVCGLFRERGMGILFLERHAGIKSNVIIVCFDQHKHFFSTLWWVFQNAKVAKHLQVKPKLFLLLDTTKGK